MAKQTAINASRMKASNYRRILEELRIHPFSRSELSRRMGLTRSAISLIVDTLLQRGILIEGDAVSSKNVGRSPIELHWNTDAFFCAGVAIRRGFFAVGIYGFCGNRLAVERMSFREDDTADTILDKIVRTIERAVAAHKPQGKFLGIGIGAPGPIDADMGMIDVPTNLEIFHKYPIVPLLSRRMSCPVVIANDASAHAIAELCYGVKDRYDSFLVIEVTGGLGAGLVLNGKPVMGAFGNGNEIGHTTINLSGERCQCGNIGCAELYAALDYVIHRAQYIVSVTSWREIVDLAEAGDKNAFGVVREEAMYLSTLAVNMINTLEINAIILNGRDICYKPQLLISLMQEQISKRLLFKKDRRIDVLTTMITDDTDTLSAANLAIENFIKTFEGG